MHKIGYCTVSKNNNSCKKSCKQLFLLHFLLFMNNYLQQLQYVRQSIYFLKMNPYRCSTRSNANPFRGIHMHVYDHCFLLYLVAIPPHIQKVLMLLNMSQVNGGKRIPQSVYTAVIQLVMCGYKMEIEVEEWSLGPT